MTAAVLTLPGSPCRRCSGAGRLSGPSAFTCPNCLGTGKPHAACASCTGSGLQVYGRAGLETMTCFRCHGRGLVQVAG